MPEIASHERLLPCLLDRLTDDAPDSRQESRDSRTVSLQRYREGVVRDLSWLLNTHAPRPEDGLAEFEQALRSVLNYGVRDVCGTTASSASPDEMQRDVLTALHTFEPRLMRRSVSVTVTVKPESMGTNALSFGVRGELWAKPISEALYVKTAIDLETGQWEIKDRPDG